MAYNSRAGFVRIVRTAKRRKAQRMAAMGLDPHNHDDQMKYLDDLRKRLTDSGAIKPHLGGRTP